MREKIARILESDIHSGEAWHSEYWKEHRQHLASRILILISEEIEKVGLSEQVIIDMVTEYHFSGQQDRHILAKNVAQAQLQKILNLLK